MATNLFTLVELDCATGIETIRELTSEELEEREELAQQSQAQLAALEAKQSARASALAKLSALGLTEEEIRAL